MPPAPGGPAIAQLTWTAGKALPTVSICVPTYNDGRFLRGSLASITAQTYPRLEILVSDDGSSDDTAEIVRSFDDPRITYHRNPRNLGQFENVNRCIQRARGEYIAIYHSDDLYDPRIVEKEVSFLEAHPEAGAVFALDRWVDDRDRVFGATRLPNGVRANICLELTDVIPALLRNKNRFLRAPTFMGRAEVFRRVGLFNTADYDIAGDLEMWLRILTEFKIGILGEHLMWYRSGRTQVSMRYNHLRTCEEHFFPILDRYLAREGLATRMDPVSLIEYAFHRCDDATFRAANMLIRGDTAGARALLRRPFPWRTLVTRLQRRKLRVLILRGLMRAGLALGAAGALRRLLVILEYGGHIEA